MSMVCVVAACAILTPSAGVNASGHSRRSIDPVVSTVWLSANIDMEGLVILDVRREAYYDAENIPGAVSEPWAVPFSVWITMPASGLLLELPPDAELFDAIGALGISASSKVVVVTESYSDEPPHYGLAAAARVADTLIYAGVVDVAILDGGYPKWVAEELPTTTKEPLVGCARTPSCIAVLAVTRASSGSFCPRR